MRRIQALALVFVAAAALTGCSATHNANNTSNVNNANQREGVVDTDANIPRNANASSVPANTGVVTNDNGNANTSGVRSINSNNRNANGNNNR